MKDLTSSANSGAERLVQAAMDTWHTLTFDSSASDGINPITAKPLVNRFVSKVLCTFRSTRSGHGGNHHVNSKGCSSSGDPDPDPDPERHSILFTPLLLATPLEIFKEELA